MYIGDCSQYIDCKKFRVVRKVFNNELRHSALVPALLLICVCHLTSLGRILVSLSIRKINLLDKNSGSYLFGVVDLLENGQSSWTIS